ncbi:MAG TPA: SRPBCC domain-containing protein [Mucilaginibacter sp.]|nr:SRPBCC domain-containing protein [Mucilaginibacter sp.]
MFRLNNADVEIQDRELVITRMFDAPRELVYRVWTEAEHVKKWWGPKPFTNPVCEIDLKPGGRFHYVMRSPDGQDFPMMGTFIEIVPDERLVNSHDAYEQADFWKMAIGNKVGDDVDFTTLTSKTTVIFDEIGDKTKLILITRFASNDVRDAMVGMQMAEGWTQSLEKLADELTVA